MRALRTVPDPAMESLPEASPVAVSAGRERGRRASRSSVEGAVQVAIMLAIGAASFTHVHEVAAGHGQAGWLAWADAVVLELMSVASGLEIRRRKRVHVSVAFPVVVLTVAVCLSLAAQVVDAEASPIGWTAAAIPALGFLVMVKIALAQGPGPVATPQGSGGAGPVADEAGGVDLLGAVPALLSRDDLALMPTVRAAAAALECQGDRVSRQALAQALRAEGHAVSNVRVSAMLRVLRAEADGGGRGASGLADGSTSRR